MNTRGTIWRCTSRTRWSAALPGGHAVHGLPSMAAYADFLRANAQELDLLFKEMLIGVTSFFRDPEVWQDLQDKVLPVLMERHADDAGPMRAWVVGCSTGEEAYSLAMAFIEALDALPATRRRELQIFATDLNADAIAAARSGRFGATIARDLSPQRLARFFTQRPHGYQIDKRVRDMVLFAQHDVIMDPPFTRLDIVSCRNLMIYFGPALQKRLVPLFHYSLRPGGALLLGGSETVGRAQSLFRPLDQKSRLYWRSDNGGAGGAVVFPTHSRPANAFGLAGDTSGAHPHSSGQPAGTRRSDAAAVVFARGGAGERRRRHRLHQRAHRPLSRTCCGQGELEHPRDGAARHSRATGRRLAHGAAAKGPGRTARLRLDDDATPAPRLTSPCRRSCSPSRWRAW
jgi:chemotaxis methyl-accepting protein methylase